MVTYVVSGILLCGCLAALLLTVAELRYLLKIKRYRKAEAVVTRKIQESWSGDSANRSGGEYEYPVVEFYAESFGTLAFVLRQPEHQHYTVGDKITVAYQAENPNQAIVADSRQTARRMLGHAVVSLILLCILILFWHGS